jgi:RNase H-like domain found in reverse transcriptase
VRSPLGTCGISTEACTDAFQALKVTVAQEPIMVHFGPSEQCFVKCDSSDAANSRVVTEGLIFITYVLVCSLQFILNELKSV